MEDRVAEVLAQRSALESSAATGIALSVVLHAAITGIAAYAALHQKPPQMVNMLSIRLAPVAAPAAITPAAAKPAAPAAPRTIQEPQAVTEQPKKAEAKPLPRTVPFSPFGKSPKKGSEVAPPPVRVPPAAAAPGSGSAGTIADVPLGGAGVTGLEGGDFPYTMYIENMKRLIGAHWFRPQVTAGTTTTVYFAIDRDGSIREAKNEVSSGTGSFDRAALRAILESSPLPPLPFAYNGNYLGVHLTFK